MVQTTMGTNSEKRKGSTTLNIVVPIELKNRLIEEAKHDDRTMRAQILHILKRHFKITEDKARRHE